MKPEGTGPRLPDDMAVVVPSYNSGPSVFEVVEGLLGVLDRIIVVDDGSTDGSIEAVRGLPVRLVTMPENRGKGHALLAGYAAALEDRSVVCVGSVDADGQHDPVELPRLYERFKAEQADFVIGSRDFRTAETPWRSRLGNWVTMAVAGWLLKRRLPDTQSGYRLLSRRFIEEVCPTVEGGRYETEMELLGRALGGGYKVVVAPIKTIYEAGNPSSHFKRGADSLRIYRTLLRTAWQIRRP